MKIRGEPTSKGTAFDILIMETGEKPPDKSPPVKSQVMF